MGPCSEGGEPLLRDGAGPLTGWIPLLRDEAVACTLVHPRLANTRSAARIFPASTPGMVDPAVVGRKLAGKIESTRPVIAVDWTTKVGLALARRFPGIVRRGTRRFLDEREATAGRNGDRGASGHPTGDAPDHPE